MADFPVFEELPDALSILLLANTPVRPVPSGPANAPPKATGAPFRLPSISSSKSPSNTSLGVPGVLPILLLVNTPGLPVPSGRADAPAEATPNTLLEERPGALSILLLANNPGPSVPSGPMNVPPKSTAAPSPRASSYVRLKTCYPFFNI
jgi:hypothetical protein